MNEQRKRLLGWALVGLTQIICVALAVITVIGIVQVIKSIQELTP